MYKTLAKKERKGAYANICAYPLASKQHILYIYTMQKEHGISPEHKEIVERRKRAFKLALSLRGATQASWAAKHGVSETEVSSTLTGRRHNAQVLALVYSEIAEARKIAPREMAGVL